MSKRHRSALASRRARKGFKQQQLAEILGVSQPYLSMIETGRAAPPTDVLLKLAEQLDCTPNTILKDLGLM